MAHLQLHYAIQAILDEDDACRRVPARPSAGAIDAIVKEVRGDCLDTLLPITADCLPGDVFTLGRNAAGWSCTIHAAPIIAIGFGTTPTAAIHDAKRDYASRDPEAAKRARIARLRSELLELGAAA